MALDSDALSGVVSVVCKARETEARRLDVLHAALSGSLDDIYAPRSATTEYRRLVNMANFDITQMVVGSLAQALYVEAYRTGNGDLSPLWSSVWQPNRMDARQSGLYRAAVAYGAAYAAVLPDHRDNAPSPVSVTPYSPRQVTALYADSVHDEWPEYVMVWGRNTDHGREGWLYDDEQAYGILIDGQGKTHIRLDSNGQPLTRRHGLGVCPFVRYLDSYDDLDEGPIGKIEPLLPAQRQLNQTTFSLLMAMQYGAFRQRWVTGMAIPEDEKGQPIEPFNAAVNRVWQSDSPDTRFGDFEATDLRPLLDLRDKTLLYIANKAQIPPHNMVVGSGISNISADALAALESAHRQDIIEHQHNFGEGHEQVFRLSGLIMGDEEAWNDRSSEAVWRDTTPRSLGQVLDALGKGSQMLQIPPRGLWPLAAKALGASQQDVQQWEDMADERDILNEIGDELDAQNAAAGQSADQPSRESGPDAIG